MWCRFFVSCDCIRPIVVFYVPVVLHVWIGIMEYCLYGGICFVFGLTWKSSLNQQWHCSVLSLGNSTRQFFKIPPRQHRAELPVYLRSMPRQKKNIWWFSYIPSGCFLGLFFFLQISIYAKIRIWIPLNILRQHDFFLVFIKVVFSIK